MVSEFERKQGAGIWGSEGRTKGVCERNDVIIFWLKEKKTFAFVKPIRPPGSLVATAQPTFGWLVYNILLSCQCNGCSECKQQTFVNKGDVLPVTAFLFLWGTLYSPQRQNAWMRLAVTTIVRLTQPVCARFKWSSFFLYLQRVPGFRTGSI